MFVNEAAYLAVVAAPFGPASPGAATEGFVRLRTADDLDAAVDKLAGTFAVSLPDSVWPRMTVSVPVSRFADLKPANVVKNCPELAGVLRAAAFVDEAPGKGLTLADMAAALGRDFGPLPVDFSLPADGGGGASPGAASAASGTVDAILDMVAAPDSPPAPGAFSGLAASWKKSLSDLAGGILAAIFADPEFRAAEAAWRGVRFILQNAAKDSPLCLALAGLPADEPAMALPGVLDAVAERFEDAPPGLILADVFLDGAPARLEVWRALAETGTALISPAAAALPPAFFHIDSWDEISRLGYPSTALADAAYAKWRKLAESPEASMLGALFNRIVLRPAYGPDNPSRTVPLVEAEALWGSPVYALGAAVARSFAVSGWPHLIGLGGGVALGDLPVTVRHGRAACVEAALSDDQLIDFAKAGFMPLGAKSGGDVAFFRRPASVDGSPFSRGLFFSRILGFFFASRTDARLAETVKKGKLEDFAGLLEMRFNVFFEKSGHGAPSELSIEAEPVASDGENADEAARDRPGVRLHVRFYPSPGLDMGREAIDFSFLW